MDWRGLRRSDNVEDARGRGGRRGASVGLGGLVAILAVSWLFDLNPAQLLRAVEGGGPPQPQQAAPRDDEDRDFVRAILGDTEDVWTRVFPAAFKRPYEAPKLVLFSGGVTSGCGAAQTQSGPFYCPADGRVYLDMAFFQYLKATATAGDDFARAYAIAHEVGHHLQDLEGTLGRVQQRKRGSSKADANALQVRVELQADCYAGVWGHFTQQRALVARKDLEGAMAAASQIGDDYLQKQAGRAVTPESFTHGSSAQRVAWFKRGLDSGDPLQCDTFAQP